jgi:hypothetical protein
MGDGMSGGGDEPAAEAVWASARQRYEQGAEAVSAIAADLGIAAQALTARARALGWKLRGKAKTKKAGTRETIQRLKSLLQQRLSDLEAQIGVLGEAASAASSERDIRAMNTLVRTLEKVLELERKDRAQRSKQRKLSRDFDDAEREALADKLDALRREHGHGDDAEGHELPPVAAAQP